jgi:hypothetical protein
MYFPKQRYCFKIKLSNRPKSWRNKPRFRGHVVVTI